MIDTTDRNVSSNARTFTFLFPASLIVHCVFGPHYSLPTPPTRWHVLVIGLSALQIKRADMCVSE